MRRFYAIPVAAFGRSSAESGLDSFDRVSRLTISRLFYNTFFRGIDFHCNVMDRTIELSGTTVSSLKLEGRGCSVMNSTREGRSLAPCAA
jgi:hypothetical protein